MLAPGNCYEVKRAKFEVVSRCDPHGRFTPLSFRRYRGSRACGAAGHTTYDKFEVSPLTTVISNAQKSKVGKYAFGGDITLQVYNLLRRAPSWTRSPNHVLSRHCGRALLQAQGLWIEQRKSQKLGNMLLVEI